MYTPHNEAADILSQIFCQLHKQNRLSAYTDQNHQLADNEVDWLFLYQIFQIINCVELIVMKSLRFKLMC